MKDHELRGFSYSSRYRYRGHCRYGSAAMLGLGLAAISSGIAKSADAYLPIVMPITGFLSVEGGSQRNGAVMALEHAPGGKTIDFPVFDTGTSATGAAAIVAINGLAGVAGLAALIAL